MPRFKPFAERFLDKILKTDSCWIWRGKKSKSGYGMVYLSGGRYRSAHRVSWELFVGSIPDNLYVLHKCDNPACVNPSCLFIGTQTNNMKDMSAKVRSWSQNHRTEAAARIARVRKRPPVGESHHLSRLTDEKVREIRKRRAEGQKYEDIAAAVGVGKSTVGRVVNADTNGGWSHVL